MVQSIAARNNNVAIAHLCYVTDVTNISQCQSALVQNITCVYGDTMPGNAAPQLLLDDTDRITAGQ